MSTIAANPYRSLKCHELRASHVGKTVRLAGFIHRQRDHGGLLFIDLRDTFGMTQCVVQQGHPAHAILQNTRVESVVSIEGVVKARPPETVNKELPTGEIELDIATVDVLSSAEVLPMQVASDENYSEELRLKYRFLDLRRAHVRDAILKRSAVIDSLTRRMKELGFVSFQTPILTASSPEGARDYLVPSRVHKGKFYALPQAPQIFKQLLMVSGFDKYFQIAPCFRDEDGRADRTPGEFYQLDFEMAYATQEEVFAVLESIYSGVFAEFCPNHSITSTPFPRIPYHEAMLKYGSDKPDLRFGLQLADVTEIFKHSDFKIFKSVIEKGGVVRAIPAPKTASMPRSFFDGMNEWAKQNKAAGLGYVVFENGQGQGPIAKFLSAEQQQQLRQLAGVTDGDAVFFSCSDDVEAAAKLAGQARLKLADTLKLIPANTFAICFIVDFPMFKRNEDTGQIEFEHNPFSMPQGGLEALKTQDPLTIKAYQYDVVCNGYEVCSGAIRNHRQDVMIEAFRLAGYDASVVEKKFGSLWQAFKYGAPPHGGAAPGIDRIVMLITGNNNIREVIAFPMNQQAQDLLMGSPSEVTPQQLKELGLQIVPDKKSTTAAA